MWLFILIMNIHLRLQELIEFSDVQNDTETNWYKLDIYLYKDLIIAFAKCKKMDDVMQFWELGRHEKGGFVP